MILVIINNALLQHLLRTRATLLYLYSELISKIRFIFEISFLERSPHLKERIWIHHHRTELFHGRWWS